MARMIGNGSRSDISAESPNLYRAGDQRPELPMPETVVLWAMRTWVAGCRLNMPTKRYISPVFAELGAPEAAGFLCGLMWKLGHSASRKIAIHGPCHPRVSEDEQALLDVLALTQDEQTFERLLLLRTLLRPLAATPAGNSASGLVRELNRGGLFLAACYVPVRCHAYPPEALHSGSDQGGCAQAS